MIDAGLQLERPPVGWPLRREALASAVLAAVAAALLAWLGPPGSDFAAHAYQRTLFLEHGFSLWNNFWYAGRYSFVTYSVLYYPLAALVGIRLLGVVSVAVAALAFTVVVLREWGPTARWSGRTFALVWAGIVLAAAFPFALGAALALLALWALQARSSWRFGAFALLTFAASPLAFVLLALLVVGIGLAKRARGRGLIVPAASLGAVAGLAVILWRLFPGEGLYPFTLADVVVVSAFCAFGALLTRGVERARVLGTVLLVYGAGCIVVYFVPSALGSNVIRLQYLAVPIAVLCASLRSWRPLYACISLVLFAGVWNATPLIRSFTQDVRNPAARQSYWQPAIRYLHAHLSPEYRVEAVDTTGHWPALYLAAAKIPLARGWFRQNDFPQNATLYGPLTPRSYLAWLRSLGVRYVVLGKAAPDYSSKGEAALLESGHSGLGIVMRTPDLTVFAVPKPTGILTGSPGGRVIDFSQARLVLHVDRSGRYRLAVRYSPYWQTSAGCLAPRGDGMTEVVARSAGRAVLSFDVDATRALQTLVGHVDRNCASAAGGSRPR